jgi:hypothetical protein
LATIVAAIAVASTESTLLGVEVGTIKRVGEGNVVPTTVGDGIDVANSLAGVMVAPTSTGTVVTLPGSTAAGAAQLTIRPHPRMMLTTRCHMTPLPFCTGWFIILCFSVFYYTPSQTNSFMDKNQP